MKQKYLSNAILILG